MTKTTSLKVKVGAVITAITLLIAVLFFAAKPISAKAYWVSDYWECNSEDLFNEIRGEAHECSNNCYKNIYY